MSRPTITKINAKALHNHNPRGWVSRTQLDLEYVRTKEHVQRAAAAVDGALALHPTSIHLGEIKRAHAEITILLNAFDRLGDADEITMDVLRYRTTRASACANPLGELISSTLLGLEKSASMSEIVPVEACGTLTGKTPANFVESLAAFLKFRDHVYDAVREIKATRGLHSLDNPHYVNGKPVYFSTALPETYEQLIVEASLLAQLKKELQFTGHFDGEPALAALQMCKIMANAGFDYGVEESDLARAREQLDLPKRETLRLKFMTAT